MNQTDTAITTKTNNGGVTSSNTNRYMSSKNQAIKNDITSAAATSIPVSTTSTSIEDLYKYFGILADAKQQAGQVGRIKQFYLIDFTPL